MNCRVMGNTFLLGLVLCGVVAAEEEARPALQYEFERIQVPAARSDEPLASQLSIENAAKHLDDGAAAWSGSRKCVSCHTNGTYLTLRPLLNAHLGPANPQLRDFAVDQLRSKQAQAPAELLKSTNPAQVVYIAAGLAEWDAQSTGKLSAETNAALQLMFKLQQPSGSWGSLDCWPPYESDAFHLATVAMTAVSIAPGWQAGLHDEDLKSQVAKLTAYLRETPPPHDYGRVLLLGTATRTKNLLDEAEQQQLVQMILSHQQADGGWSLRTFAKPEAWGRGNRAEKLRSESDFEQPASDGHMTGLALVVLRSAGLPKDDSRIQQGVAWLKANQRQSGRWWTRSLNTDTQHFITYSGTAFPLLALALCDEIPLHGK